MTNKDSDWGFSDPDMDEVKERVLNSPELQKMIEAEVTTRERKYRLMAGAAGAALGFLAWLGYDARSALDSFGDVDKRIENVQQYESKVNQTAKELQAAQRSASEVTANLVTSQGQVIKSIRDLQAKYDAIDEEWQKAAASAKAAETATESAQASLAQMQLDLKSVQEIETRLKTTAEGAQASLKSLNERIQLTDFVLRMSSRETVALRRDQRSYPIFLPDVKYPEKLDYYRFEFELDEISSEFDLLTNVTEPGKRDPRPIVTTIKAQKKGGQTSKQRRCLDGTPYYIIIDYINNDPIGNDFVIFRVQAITNGDVCNDGDVPESV